MKESQFVKKNFKRWETLEKSVASLKKAGRRKQVDENLSEDYIRLSDDLGYSQTFYNRRSIRLYLNNLTSDVYREIHRNKERKTNPLLNFWWNEVPNVMYEGRRFYLIAFVIFAVAMIIGAFSLELDANFANHILSDGYVKMTKDNIAAGDPLRVFKDEDSFDMFVRIAMNNLWVLIISFTMGLFFGIGTIAALISNGVMVGVFQYFFYKEGLLFESFLTIWQHGTVEISSIVLGSGSGLMLGAGYLFPGSYSRMLSLRLHFYRGVKVIIALLPFIVFAAWVESYITRLDHMDRWIRLAFIIVNAILMIGYFVYLPWAKRKSFKPLESASFDRSIEHKEVENSQILSVGEVFQSSLSSWQKWVAKKAWIPAVMVLVAVISYYFSGYFLNELSAVQYNGAGTTLVLLEVLNTFTQSVYDTFGLFALAGANIPLLSISIITLISITQISVSQYFYKSKSTVKIALLFVSHTAVLLGLSLLMGESNGLIFLLLCIGYPILSFGLNIAFAKQVGYFKGLIEGVQIYGAQFVKNISWVFLVGFSLILAIMLVQGSLSAILMYFLNTFTAFNSSAEISRAVLTALSLTTLLGILALAHIGTQKLIENYWETKDATRLIEEINAIPPRKKRYGIDESI